MTDCCLKAIGKIRKAKVELDPVLAARLPDERRGLTVIARPSPEVRRRVARYLGQLLRLEPDQHYYAVSEFHVTVLSLFTATVNHRPWFAQRERFISAADSALRNAAPFRVQFEGVTASPGTVMIQGFLEDGALNDLRDALRRELRIRGLAGGVDGRYRLETAHLTVVRFRTPLRASERFAAALEQARERSFGTTTFRSLSLVENDWYMSRRVSRTLKRYRLTGSL